MFKLKLLSSLLILCLTMSCSKNKGGVFIPAAEGEMTGKIDNRTFKAQDDGVAVSLNIDSEEFQSLSINAVGEDGSIIVALINNFKGAGTYQIVSDDSQLDYEAGVVYISPDEDPVTYYTPLDAGNHGSIQIQEFSRQKARGKFSATVYDPIAKKNVELTNMVFSTSAILVTE